MQGSGIIVLGAGLAGTSCAGLLAQAGQPVRIIDKGRGIGGRMATRRVTLEAGTISFDHGAQYLRPRDPAFQAALVAAGAMPWGDAGDRFVGTPSMPDIPRALAAGVQVTGQTEITRLTRDGDLWHLTGPDTHLQARRVILTIPAPQALRLLGPDHPLAPALAQVIMTPCLTLMAAFPRGAAQPFSHRLDPDHPLAWIAQDSSKPGRSLDAVTWVAQASDAFSKHHLESPADALAAQMLPMLCNVIGADPQTALHARTHRWRYARAARPLGQPFVQDADRSLYLGGDWCLGARAEHAWHSGQAIARDILAHADVA